MYQNEKTILASEHSVGSFRVGQIEINAPQRLNAIDAEMLKQIGKRLFDWECDPEIALIVLSSKSPKAFCAGGDIKGLVQEMNQSTPEKVARAFFTTEYSVDFQIHKLKKPSLCLIDGLAIGGGIGLMNGCKFRVITENSSFSMPEISIGLFPDVGASYFLPRLKNSLGLLMGMTGLRIGPKEAIDAGLADYFINSKQKDKLFVDLLHLEWTGNHEVDLKILNKYLSHISSQPEISILEAGKNYSELFTEDYAETERNIIHFFKSKTEYRSFLENFEYASPLSKKVTHELLKRGSKLDLKDCFLQEWSLVVNICTKGDFREGVRALLINKDRKPKWISEDKHLDVAEYFKSPEPHELKLVFAKTT